MLNFLLALVYTEGLKPLLWQIFPVKVFFKCKSYDHSKPPPKRLGLVWLKCQRLFIINNPVIISHFRLIRIRLP